MILNRLLVTLSLLTLPLISCPAFSKTEGAYEGDRASEKLDPENVDLSTLTEPMYRPLIERYILDEIKQLRAEQAQTKIELTKEVLDREHASIDRGVAYATDTITYFFYLIAGVSSVFVLVGWTSLRDIKEKVHSLADEEISKLVEVYEGRLNKIEEQLHQKTEHIEINREEIALTQQVQSLWLRAAQEPNAAKKIAIFDQIIELRGQDCEALTYKADAALELDEPQWAASLCKQALEINPDNNHAFYQLACAYAVLGLHDDALFYLEKTIDGEERYREDIQHDPALAPLKHHAKYKELVGEVVITA